MSSLAYLLDVNVLIAITQPEHIHFQKASDWFNHETLDWGICPLTEAGFLRLSASPSVGKLSYTASVVLLELLAERPGYRYWPISSSWRELTAPFQYRIHGHKQITDAYLLGLAIKENGILVTLDRAMKTMAGPQYSKHVLVLESLSGFSQ